MYRNKVWIVGLIIVLSALSGCKSAMVKQVDNEPSISMLVDDFKQHIIGKKIFSQGLIDGNQFYKRVNKHYDEISNLRKNSNDSIAGKQGMNVVIDRLYGSSQENCHQFDGVVVGERLKAFIECPIGEGFTIYELLIDYRRGSTRLVDIKILTTGSWWSEVYASILSDKMGFSKIRESFKFIGEVRNGDVDYSKYYRLNGYIKTNRMLALSLNSVVSEPRITAEMSESLEKICPNDPECALSVVDYYFVKGNYSKAIEKLEIARSYYPRSIELSSLLVELYMDSGQAGKALLVGQDNVWGKPASSNGFLEVFSAAAVIGDQEKASSAAAALVHGFHLKSDDIKNEYNQKLIEDPAFWQKVNDKIDRAMVQK